MFVINLTLTVNTAVSKQHAKQLVKAICKDLEPCIISVSEFPSEAEEPIVYPAQWIGYDNYPGHPL